MHWRDTHLRIEGPVVSDFQALFMETWGRQKGKALANRDYFPHLNVEGDAVVQAIGSSPEDPFSLIYVTLITAINSAEREVYLTNAYFIPDEQLLQALKDAAARGVDVRLILPSTTDSDLVFYASRSFYGELLHAGVKIYERQDALLHAKTALIDGVWSTIGSTNLDWRSFLYNQEINAVILGHDFGNRMRAMFEAIDAAEDSINLETFIFEDDEVGQRFADLLIAKQQAGVQVNLIYDSVGSLTTPDTFFNHMRESGINVLEYNPVNPLKARVGWDVNERDHRKVLVVDGKVAFVGGINISSVYSSGGSMSRLAQSAAAPGENMHWRDTHLRIEGPVVSDFQALFMETWGRQKGKALAIESEARRGERCSAERA